MPKGHEFADIKTLREKKGMSITQLSRASGVHRIQIYRYEKQQIMPSAKSSMKLAKALGCKIDDLFREETEG